MWRWKQAMPTEHNLALDGWRVPPARYPEWMRRRWSSVATATATDVDRLGWIRQSLRWFDIQHSQETVSTAQVPAEVIADQALVNRFGLVRRGPSGVAALPWRPAWLKVEGTGCPDDACGAQPRRPHEETVGDPVLRLVDLSTYRSVGQRGAMRAVILAPPGSTLLVALPTGAGKSLLGQLPPLVEGGLTVVVVPTVALALDQARALREQSADWGEEPYAYTGGRGVVGDAQREAIRKRIDAGSQRIVFAAPEAVVGSLRGVLWSAAQSGYLKRLVIDEAHLVDAWGEDFRPEYQELAGFRLTLLSVASSLRTVLLSATITETTRKTLAELFGGRSFGISAGAALRAEPAYWASKTGSEEERRQCVIEAVHHLPRPLILYSSTKEDAVGWYELLKKEGYRRVGMMTGETAAAEREDLIQKWSEGSLDLMAATSAFGMGIDQPHIRTVIHATLPESLDRFYQETGRTGRDGSASVALVVTAPNDTQIARSLAARKYLTYEVGYTRWERLFSSFRPLESLLADVEDPIATLPATLVPFGQSDVVEPRLGAVDVAVGVTAVMHSRKNEYWNLRTLTMMHRVGLLSMRGPVPWFDESLPPTYRMIALTNPRHRDPDEWEQRIGVFRSERRLEAEKGLRALEDLLRSERCWSKSLKTYYSLDDEVPPAQACGGCPTCRREDDRRPFALSGLEPTVPWELTIDTLGELKPSETLRRYQIIGVEVPVGNSLEVKQRMVRAMRGLIRLGYRQVVMPEPLNELLPDVQRGVLPVISAFDFSPFLLNMPTVVLRTMGEIEPEILKPNPPLPRVVFYPEDVPDPEIPYRLLRHRIETWSLAHLLSELST